MKEIEVKAKIANIQTLKDVLTNLGCVFSKPTIQHDTIFLHHSLTPQAVQRGNVILRLRKSNGKCILTLKKQLSNELDNIEREVEVMNEHQAAEILHYLDFKEVIQVNKERLQTNFQGITICLDEVEGLGYFIEVEKMSSTEDSQQVQNELFQFLETLGVKKTQQVFKGYDRLLEETQASSLT